MGASNTAPLLVRLFAVCDHVFDRTRCLPASVAGSSIVMVVPSPVPGEAAVMLPEWSLTRARAMVSPSPLPPPSVLIRDGSTRWNRSNTQPT